jgi:VWFA-related protein
MKPGRRSARVAALIAMMLLATGGAPLQAVDEPPPHQSGKKEVVTVRLVTMDVVVFDREDRTVSGLAAEDFDLFVDSRRVKVDTFDPACSAGGLESPRGGWTSRWTEPTGAGDGSDPRRVIFVFDYLHLSQVKSTDGTPLMAQTMSIRQLMRSLRDLPEAPAEEIMIAVLDGGLRVEQPFTAGRDHALATLGRMEKDVTLYAGHFGHVTEDPLFTGLNALVDLVDATSGSKAAVIFTGGIGPGESYDADYRALANHATMARVSFYPVDCSALNDNGRAAGPFR